MPGTVLVVDDEKEMVELISATLKKGNYQVDSAHDGNKAIEKIRGNAYDLVITDLKMPKVSGMDILREAKRVSTDTNVVMITGYATISSAVEAMKQGAFDYIPKPFSKDELNLVAKRVFDYRRLVMENQHLKSELAEKYDYHNILGRSEAMRKVFETIEMVGPSNSTVLIQGESGTGKELVARAIHYSSPRAENPFVKLNCAAVPEGLMESELFGHEKGAFTGAVRKTKGRFERADKGTLLFDEISEMSYNLQAKLLRVLQEREFERVGDGATQRVDVRILATTNRNLREEVKAKAFREDLYYRLNVVPVFLPPLRDRKEDIPMLVEYFLDRFCYENGVERKVIDEEGLGILQSRDWPGNVRELEHTIERAVVLSRGEKILPELLMLEGVPDGDGGGEIAEVGITLDEMERRLILKTLEREGGNKTRTANILGISVRTLRNKLNRYRRESKGTPRAASPAKAGPRKAAAGSGASKRARAGRAVPRKTAAKKSTAKAAAKRK
jgi:DNA-binding NtrC family response regulator